MSVPRRGPVVGAATVVGAAVGLLAVAGCALPTAAETTSPAAAPAAPQAAAVATVPAPATTGTRAPAEPVTLTVPAIGLRTGPVLAVGRGESGALDVPATAVGWFARGPAPGARGPAVIAGRADQAGRPGIFDRLQELAPGDEVTVARADGTAAVFGVYRVEHQVVAPALPTGRVYGDTEPAELRLVTAGAFDPGSAEQPAAVVAYARLLRVA